MNARSRWQRILGGIALILIVISMSACGEVDATWKVVKITSKAEKSNFYLETIDVRSCSEVEKKTCGCTASAGRSFTVKTQAGVQVNVIVLPVDATVDLKAEFGMTSNQEQGNTETLALAPAPPGQVFRYKVRKTYRTFTGKARVRSPMNEEREVDYTFQASCTQSIESKEVLSCAEADNPKAETAQPADTSKGKSATQDLKSALIGIWAFSNGSTIEYTTDGKEIISVWYLPNCTYTWIDDTHIEEKGRNGATMIWEVKLDGDSLTLVGKDLSIHLTRAKSS